MAAARVVKKGVIAVVGLFLCVVLLGYILDMEIYPTPDQAPSIWVEQYIELPSGRTHYIEKGNGPAIILVHGFGGNLHVWTKNIDQLAKHFHVYAYDLFGRGLSDRSPNYAYDENLYAQQLLEFIDALKLEKVGLVGLSLGGAISQYFTTKYPERVQALFLISSAGLPLRSPIEKLSFILELPLLGKALTKITLPILTWRMFKDTDPVMRDLYKRSAQIVGYRDALKKTDLNMHYKSMSMYTKQLGQSPLPVFVLWGENDHVIPVDHYKQYRMLIPQSQGEVLAGVGHLIQIQAAEQVNHKLITFFSQYLTAPTQKDF